MQLDVLSLCRINNLVGMPLPQKTDAGTPAIAIRPPGTQTSVTVRVAFPPSAQSDHCVWITDLMAGRWLLFEWGSIER